MFVLTMRTLVLYIVIVVSLRLMGKRQLGELQPSELVVTILISNIASLPIEDTAIPLLSGITPILLLVCFEIFVSYLSLKSRAARKIITGNPIPIIRNGKIDQKKMSELRFSIDDLMEELRGAGVFDLRDVDHAIVETNGKLSVFQNFQSRNLSAKALGLQTPTNDCPPPAVLISDGELVAQGLQECNLRMDWLEKRLAENKLAIKDVFLMICDRNANYLLVPKEKKS